jgi:hypothetical protein
MNRDFIYENNNTVHTSVLGECVKCKNFFLCGKVLPKSSIMKSHYLCYDCHVYFGKYQSSKNGMDGEMGVLNVIKNLDCMICFETKTGISLPNCDHYVCIDCFKRCYYGDDSGEPQFPFPDIQEEFYKDNHETPNSKWLEYYTLIIEYEKEWEMWHDKKLENCAREDFLRKCPLCRK